jgi:hypothetical protein
VGKGRVWLRLRLRLRLLRMREHVIWGVVSDVHFVVVEGMNGEVIGRMGWMGINRLVKVGR